MVALRPPPAAPLSPFPVVLLLILGAGGVKSGGSSPALGRSCLWLFKFGHAPGVESGIGVKVEAEAEPDVRAEADSGLVAVVAVAPLRLVPCCFLPVRPVASVLALALTLDVDLAFAMLAAVTVMVVRERPDGGGDPIVVVVEKVRVSEVVRTDVDSAWTSTSPPVGVLIMSLLVVVAAVVAALWTAERASENADCSVASV